MFGSKRDTKETSPLIFVHYGLLPELGLLDLDPTKSPKFTNLLGFTSLFLSFVLPGVSPGVVLFLALRAPRLGFIFGIDLGASSSLIFLGWEGVGSGESLFSPRFS